MINWNVLWFRQEAKTKSRPNKGGGGGQWKLADHRLSGEVVSCTANEGLRCLNEEQTDNMCEDYAIRFLCACGKTLWINFQ